jgi:hypothetical protein
MMICPACGCKNPDRSKFCCECGKQIRDSRSDVSAFSSLIDTLTIADGPLPQNIPTGIDASISDSPTTVLINEKDLVLTQIYAIRIQTSICQVVYG